LIGSVAPLMPGGRRSGFANVQDQQLLVSQDSSAPIAEGQKSAGSVRRDAGQLAQRAALSGSVANGSADRLHPAETALVDYYPFS
jgi:hypothetical protein